jgi:hypothetical protein
MTKKRNWKLIVGVLLAVGGIMELFDVLRDPQRINAAIWATTTPILIGVLLIGLSLKKKS